MYVDLAFIALGIGGTLMLALGALAVGSLLAGGLLLARSSRFAVLRVLFRTYVEVVRAVPPLVWIFLLFFGLPELGIKLQPFPAAFTALSLIAASYLAEIFRAGLSAVDHGQLDASRALGLGRFTTVWSVIIPQMLRAALPAVTTYTIGLLKDSSLASIIGVAELTFRAGVQAQRTGSALESYIFVGLLYMVLSFVLAYFGRTIGSAADRRAKGKLPTRKAGVKH